MGKVLGDAFHGTFKGLPNVIGIRSLGLAAAVELAPMAGAPGKRAYDIFVDCFKKGALVRPAGDTVVIAPPYIVEKSHIDQLVNTLADSHPRPRLTGARPVRPAGRSAAQAGAVILGGHLAGPRQQHRPHHQPRAGRWRGTPSAGSTWPPPASSTTVLPGTRAASIVRAIAMSRATWTRTMGPSCCGAAGRSGRRGSPRAAPPAPGIQPLVQRRVGHRRTHAPARQVGAQHRHAGGHGGHHGRAIGAATASRPRSSAAPAAPRPRRVARQAAVLVPSSAISSARAARRPCPARSCTTVRWVRWCAGSSCTSPSSTTSACTRSCTRGAMARVARTRPA
jgi:hypothetical protein